jgi:hypothetical protein
MLLHRAVRRRLFSRADGPPFVGQVVYFNDAVSESYLRVPASELAAGQYTLVVQGMSGPSKRLLVYLRVSSE